MHLLSGLLEGWRGGKTRTPPEDTLACSTSATRSPHDEHLVAPRRRVWPVASHLDLRLRQGACRSACNPTASAPPMTPDACRACCAAGTEAPLHDPLREARCVGCAVQGGGDRDASALASLHGVRSDGTLYSLQERIALWRQRSGRALRARPRIMRVRPAQRQKPASHNHAASSRPLQPQRPLCARWWLALWQGSYRRTEHRAHMPHILRWCAARG